MAETAPDCDHCKNDPPAGHTCPVCGRVSYRALRRPKVRRPSTAATQERQSDG